eukprot:TRINITY_DN32891_c0_g1_i1.p1 TRINITY_DN32891_c0_g1~~TRINITY_DN32891_c0_g1_i1.p1  ORF type:complete len:192 (+),score=65.23 TRINITY_DN32891_c0_g1_i1:53-577(+)
MAAQDGYKDELMAAAFAEAEKAATEEEVPIGCVFAVDGKVVAAGRNRTNATRNGCEHAEMVAIAELFKAEPDAAELLRRSDLYVTVEPCVMCASAVLMSGVRRVWYGCGNERFGGCGSVLNVHQKNPFRELPCSGGHRADSAVKLLQGFYETENTHCPDSKRRRKLPRPADPAT